MSTLDCQHKWILEPSISEVDTNFEETSFQTGVGRDQSIITRHPKRSYSMDLSPIVSLLLFWMLF
jgi:hypothetical protein